MWPFKKDTRPDWQKGDGYFIYVPDDATPEEFSVFTDALLFHIYKKRNSFGGFLSLPSRVWMSDEEYAALDPRLKKFLIDLRTDAIPVSP